MTKTERGYTLSLPLPFVSGADVQLTQSSSNELIVHIGNRKRLISLPHTLASMDAEGARCENGVLYVTFVPSSLPSPPSSSP
jgi:HSP20 family molecular chaperone IbpA